MRTLHPQVEALRRERLAAGVRPVYELSVAEARRADRPSAAARREPVAAVDERSIQGPGGALRLRIYRPERGGPLPALVYCFGGGWVLGSLDASDGICRSLARRTPCAVAAVDYRLAPEHPFPAAVEDCYAATRWLADHGAELGLDPARIAVGGGSAGANLAAAVTRLAVERGGPPLVFQLLAYPPTDARATAEVPAERPFFERRSADWCWSHYLKAEADRDDPLASPLRANDLAGLPPALVITAELDPLRDEGERYAERLAAAGVPTELVRFDGMVHGFFGLTGVLDAAEEAQELAAERLRSAFA